MAAKATGYGLGAAASSADVKLDDASAAPAGQPVDWGAKAYNCLWIVFFPFVAIYHAVRLLIVPCIGAYCNSGLSQLLFYFQPTKYEDEAFPASPASIGKWDNKTQEEIAEQVIWLRGDEIAPTILTEEEAKALPGKAHDHTQLFSRDVEPADVCQGQLGDCWLLSAIACLAEHRGAVQRVFVTKQYNPQGRYRMRLFDKVADAWVEIEVSDEFPCDKKTRRPIFTTPNGGEIWVLLLEKAFAKFFGSYGALDGGSIGFALMALTGDPTFRFVRGEDASDGVARMVWNRQEIVLEPTAEDKHNYYCIKTDEKRSDGEMFAILLRYHNRCAVLGAGTLPGKDTVEESKSGIVKGHAYTIVRLEEMEGFRLCCLRNPWGSFEWEGPWSDKSPMWDKHPAVKAALFKNQDDGVFWIEWEDFMTRYRLVDICSRRADVDDLLLDVHEDDGVLGPCIGCAKGCGRFWCRGQGCALLCCPVVPQKETLSGERADIREQIENAARRNSV